MRLWHPGGKRRGKECNPEQFPRDWRFDPIRVVAPNSFSGEFPGEEAHLQRQQDALFS
jgi:hypothetical protein